MEKPAKLSDTRIRNTKPADKPIKLTDGGGLLLLITPSGSRLWRYRYRLNDKENVFALGEYGSAPYGESPEAKEARIAGGIFTLAEARDAHAKARALVKSGRHPAEVRAEARRHAAEARATTFEGVAREWLSRAKGKWKPATARQRERLLEADIYPEIGKRPIAELRRIDLNAVILKIEERAPQMAVLARQVFQGIFDYAEDIGAVEISVALRLAKVEKPDVVNARKLAVNDIGQFLRDCDAYQGSFEVRAAMKLAWLTLCRTMEVVGAEWSEIDLDNALWRIPAQRMKKGRDHLVPLSKQAVHLLRGLHAATGEKVYLFPNKVDRKRHASDGVLWKMTDSIGWREKFNPHGLRGTASTILNETRLWPEEVVERLLAHVEKDKTKASYNAAEYLPQRVEALQWWANFLDAKKAGKEVNVYYLPKLQQVA